MSTHLLSQVVYQHLSNENIYEFVDELANDGIIELNSAIKPYARTYIAEKLKIASQSREELNKRQQKELGFYLLEYKLEIDSLPNYNTKFDLFGKNNNLATAINPLGGFYKDKLFTFSVKPIWGIHYFIKSDENIYHRWGGAEAFAYVGDHWGFYASLRDNNESQVISSEDFFTLLWACGRSSTILPSPLP